jgi:iron-sulfur cluster assembly protein
MNAESSTTEVSQTNPIVLTDLAVKEIKHIIQDQNFGPVVYVRIAVRGGGCSGFTHLFTLDENYNEKNDVLYHQDGLTIVIDKRSAMYLDGTTVDFLEQLDKRGFKFTNPAVKTTCGCGSSFSM